MTTDSLLENKRFQELLLLTEQNDEAHDLAHFKRVTRYALEIGKEEKADMEILEAAGMLHDIARGLEAIGKTSDHLLTGAEITREMLREIGFPEEKIEPTAYCVSVHQRRTGIEAKTIEAKIIQDADLLDTYGLIYVARSILWGVQSDKYKRPLFLDKCVEDFDIEADKNLSTIHYLMHRLQDPRYNPSNLYTKTAQEIANKKFHLIEEFVSNFISEWRGE